MDEVKIALQYGDWVRYTTTNLDNNSFEFIYNISFGGPEGLWNISAEVETEQGFIDGGFRFVNVSVPVDVVRFKVVLFSPSNEAVFYRGNQVDFSVFVSEDDIDVSNVSVSCVLPFIQRLKLSEESSDYYVFFLFYPMGC